MVVVALVFSFGETFYLEGKCTVYTKKISERGKPLEELQSSAFIRPSH